MVTVDDFAEVVLSGVPRKSEPHRLLLPPPQTQRRPHGTGLEPAGPTARPSGEAKTAVVAWTPRGSDEGPGPVRNPPNIRDIGRIFGDPAGINIFSIFRAILKDFVSIWLYQESLIKYQSLTEA